MSVYSPDMFMFVDETGTDHRNHLHKYGYSLRGKRLINTSLLYRRKRVSAISCMYGILDTRIRIYSMTLFTIPHLMPFNGINPHSVVVMENCYTTVQIYNRWTGSVDWNGGLVRLCCIQLTHTNATSNLRLVSRVNSFVYCGALASEDKWPKVEVARTVILKTVSYLALVVRT